MLHIFLFSQYFNDPFDSKSFWHLLQLETSILKWYHSLLLLIFVFWLYISLGFNLLSYTVFSIAQYLIFEEILH